MTDLDICNKMHALADSAKSRNIEFNLSFKKLKRLLTQQKCYFTGIPFDDTNKGRRSIDRLDPSKGYFDDNVVAATVRINGRRADISILEVKQVYFGLKKKGLV